MSDDNPSSSGSAGVGASRQYQGSSAYTALSPVYETRRLVVAYGIQFHKDEWLSGDTISEHLGKRLKPSKNIEKVSETEYINHLQKVRFTIEETTSKQDFINYLQTPEIHLIYMGHARYGRGPCFGARGIISINGKRMDLPSEDYEEGTDSDSGIFRMGYPYIGVPVHEIDKYGYTANLVKASEGKPAAADCDSALRPYLGSLHAREPESIENGLSAKLRNYQAGDRYWTYRDSQEGTSVIHHCGWKDTLSKPSELGELVDSGDPDSDQMKCRVFAHLGCSTFVHNYKVVRKLANWRHQDNERYAYWTTAPSAPYALGPWVYSLITYDKLNAFTSWGPSLASTVERTNRYLRGKNAPYRVI